MTIFSALQTFLAYPLIGTVWLCPCLSWWFTQCMGSVCITSIRVGNSTCIPRLDLLLQFVCNSLGIEPSCRWQFANQTLAHILSQSSFASAPCLSLSLSFCSSLSHSLSHLHAHMLAPLTPAIECINSLMHPAHVDVELA